LRAASATIAWRWLAKIEPPATNNAPAPACANERKIVLTGTRQFE
jgi:hypothetical protein